MWHEAQKRRDPKGIYMSIHKINGKTGIRYRVKLRDPNGQQFSKTFKTKAEASSYQVTQVNAMQRGSWVDIRRTSITFKQLSDDWINGNTQKRQRSLDRDLAILTLHVLPQLGNQKISHIKKTDIQSLVNGWIKHGLKPRTVRRQLAVIKAILQRAVDDEILVKNPATGTKYPKPEAVDQHPLTSDEARTLLASIDPFYKPLLCIAMTTGLRWSELAGLQIHDVELMSKTPVLHVNRGLHTSSKGVSFEEPKSSAGKRTIPLAKIQVDIIASHIAETKRTMAHGDEPLFVSPKGLAMNYSNFRNRVFVPALEKSGIPKTRIHDLRRTTATILFAGKIDFKTIELIMGHSDIRMTLSAYASATPEGMKNASNSMETFISSSLNTSEQLTELLNINI
jgi:integrase